MKIAISKTIEKMYSIGIEKRNKISDLQND